MDIIEFQHKLQDSSLWTLVESNRFQIENGIFLRWTKAWESQTKVYVIGLPEPYTLSDGYPGIRHDGEEHLIGSISLDIRKSNATESFIKNWHEAMSLESHKRWNLLRTTLPERLLSCGFDPKNQNWRFVTDRNAKMPPKLMDYNQTTSIPIPPQLQDVCQTARRLRFWRGWNIYPMLSFDIVFPSSAHEMLALKQKAEIYRSDPMC